MNIIGYLVLFIFWNFIGFLIALFRPDTTGAFGMANGFEFVNPVFIYEHNYVNAFGALVLCLLYSLLCPIATICYWFYKLCTVGRKLDT